MRTLACLCTALVLSVSSIQAQETPPADGGFASGGFGAPVLKFSEMVDEFALFAGARGGWVANHSFVVGGGIYALTNTIDNPVLDEPIDQFVYGGLEVEYVGLWSDPVHFSILMLVGVGRRWRSDLVDFDHDEVFVYEPAVNLELIAASFLRVDLGAGYRFVTSVTSRDTENSDLSAFFGVFTLKFGSF